MRIGDFANIRIGHAFRSRLTGVPNGNVLVIQPKNILASGSISFGNEKPLRTEASVTKPLATGDVLVVNRGRFAAAVFELHGSETWIVPSSVLVLSITSQSVFPEYVACYLNSASGQRLFLRHSEHTTIPFIGAGNLECMSIPVPSLERQHAIIACGRAVARYAVLSNRKQELYGQLLDHEFNMQEESTGRRPR